MLEACGPWLPYIIGALIIGLFTAWWLWGRNKQPAQMDDRQTNFAPPISPAPPAAAKVAAAALAGTAAVAVAAKPKAAAPPVKKAPAKKVAAKKPATTTAAPKAKAAPVKTAAAPAPIKKAAPKKPVAAKPKAKAVAPVKKAAAEKPKTAAVAKPKVAPKPAVKPKPKAAAKPKIAAKPKVSIPDNLELLKGVGPKLNTLLKSLGITSFEQVANWKATDIREVDAKLGNFAGRISRDNWVDQAKLLLKGDVASFEKKYGILGSEIKRN